MLMKLTVLTALALSLTVVTPVSAQEREVVRTVVQLPQVLSDSNAVEKAYARLKSAARITCDSGLDRDLKSRQSDQACAREALNNAVADLNQPALSQLHAEKTGHTPSVYADHGDERIVASK